VTQRLDGNNSAGTSETSSGCSSGRSSQACEQEDDERKETANLHDLSNESIEEESEEEENGGFTDGMASQGYVAFQASPSLCTSPSNDHRPSPTVATTGYTQMGAEDWNPRTADPPVAVRLPQGYSRASTAFDSRDMALNVFPTQNQDGG